MGLVVIFALCSLAVGIALGDVVLRADRPFLGVPLAEPVTLECCYKESTEVRFSWVRHFQTKDKTIEQVTVKESPRLIRGEHKHDDWSCQTLTFDSVQLDDTGFYQCFLNGSNIPIYTHGTYLQVYKPLEKTINLSESTKNKILTAEGVLLLLCVLLPSATLLLKAKRLNELEAKKAKREEENIYQGLNLDDCYATYEQIECPQTQSPYQDVGNRMEEEEIQLEKP
ncbi:B-cell antigen receptor complex-associated protein alpha chain [Pholidichthys leucotaenia]